eukprot:TRINITY_DN2951_c0_g1_i3.p1 TRINITY_DN2951_c0_g1~~TRINITY_DN2951_c0_g1_i3.p1  ORF type:complete len:359 (-),score=93.78 TRINITY_DN2951_c0_g1_i3:289-1365(-)
MIRRPPRSTLSSSSAASDVYKRQADTQLGFAADPGWGGDGDGATWDQEIALAERLVDCVNALRPKPRFLVVCGDLVHALPPGLKMANEGGNPTADRYTNHANWLRQNSDFKRIMGRLDGIPLVCVCGNHDVGDRPTPASIVQYEAQHLQPHYFGFWCGGMRGLVLNAQLLKDSIHALEIHAAQQEWLDVELAKLAQGEAKHAVVFQHIPWFLRSERESGNCYFNLPLATREAWIGKMKAAGVTKVFCGHYHRNATALTDDGVLEMVVTSAVGRQMSEAEILANKSFKGTPEGVSDTRSGMRIVTVKESGIEHEYEEFDALEARLGLQAGRGAGKPVLVRAAILAVALAWISWKHQGKR